VAWALAAWHPERVRTLTALSTPHPAAMQKALLTSDQGLRSYYMALFQLPVLPERLLLSGGGAPLRRMLRKGGLPDELVEAVRVVARGDALLAPSVTRRLIERFAGRPPGSTAVGSDLDVLTEREREVLREVAPDVQPTEYDLGAMRWQRTGELLPDTVIDELRAHDAILLGAIGDPSVPPGILERGLLLRLRFELDHHVNLRPARLYPGVRGPLSAQPEIDLVVVREGTEGPYAGTGGLLRKDTPQEIATEVSINTAFGVERVVRDAFTRASNRPRRKLTLVHKTNVLTHAGSLWSRVVEEVSLEHPEVAVDYQHVDSTTIHLVTDPSRYDVIVTDNLFGDILTDLAAAVTGGIGLAASGNLDVSRANPSMFEPVHGSAPDIAGKGIADPTAAVLSVALLLDHLGEPELARRIEAAVAFDLATRDHQNPGGTHAVGDRLAALVSSAAGTRSLA